MINNVFLLNLIYKPVILKFNFSIATYSLGPHKVPNKIPATETYSFRLVLPESSPTLRSTIKVHPAAEYIKIVRN